MKLARRSTALLIGFLCAWTSQAQEQPNIVLFFVDDLGWTDVGYRNEQLRTPHIDRLAADSLEFSQAYVASPTCSPSRATLLTGQHPARLRIVRHIPTGAKNDDFDRHGRTSQEFNLWPKDPAQFPCRNWLPLETVTYAEALRDYGYFNLFVGKWHLGHDPFHPVHQGFDRQVGTTNWGHPKSYTAPFFSEPIATLSDQNGYLTDRLTDETVKFIQSYDEDRPFMVSMWYYNVHAPHIGRPDLVEIYRQQGLEGKQLHYAAMVSAVDESIGRIREALRERELHEKTLILFTSDQGSWFENPPFRGSKRVDTLGEGGARVPLLVHWPGVTRGGRQNQTPVQTTDIFPTLVELAGGRIDEFEDLDGVSLIPAIRGESIERERPLLGYRAYEDLYASVREGPWKLWAYRSGITKLFHVESDRYEQHDVKDSQPQVTARLVAELVAWEHELGVEEYSGVQ